MADQAAQDEPGGPEAADLGRVRNIGIVAHINAGKTTLTERILFDAGKQRHMGEVDDGTATMDFLPQEQQRGISIAAAVTNMDWRGYHISLVDTPGHVDFTAEVQRSLRVLDGVVLVVDGIAGVESQTEVVWRQAQAREIPAICFINKLDRPTADFEASLISVEEQLECRVLPLVLPLRDEGELVGLVDLVENRVVGKRHPEPALFKKSHEAVVELCAEFDDSILRDFLEGRAIAPPRLHAALRQAVLSGAVVPAICGSALHNRGVDWLLNAICRYLPAPPERPARCLDGSLVHADPEGPFCGLVFKLQLEGEDMVYVIRVYRGRLAVGDLFASARQEGVLQVRRLSHLHAAHQEEVEAASAGDVVAAEVDGDLFTGETLFAPGHPVLLEALEFERPVLSARIEAVAAADESRLESLAAGLVREDPTLVLTRDRDSGNLLISGMGELHLQVFHERLQQALGAGVRLGRPQVMLQESVTRAAEAWGRCTVGVGGAAQAFRVQLAVVPSPDGGAAEVGGVPAVGDGRAPLLRRLVQAQLDAGLSGAGPAHGLRLDLLAVEADWGADWEPAVAAAITHASRQLADAAGAVLLEPLVAYEIRTPLDSASPVLADLRSRGAAIRELDVLDGRQVIRGQVPLRRLLGYATRLRSISKGLGVVELQPAGMAERVAED